MPKIIQNIEDRIFLAAKELFYEKGYEHVNMKEIAKRSDMAVGTLYNYFSNKNELYFSVLEKSWNGTCEKLALLQGRDIAATEKLRASITLIYEEIVDRRCMGIQVRKIKDLKGDASITRLEENILTSIKTIFAQSKIKEQFRDDTDILEKIVYSLLINLTMLVDYYPDDKSKNIEYLYSGVVGFLVMPA
ncbi:MAG: TetR/AcrR family transcriptional regulator [Sphaerochaeta sp.]|nr:TetR/AcrR family transcriptional regulator [Sphaerochaeta sp.]